MRSGLAILVLFLLFALTQCRQTDPARGSCARADASRKHAIKADIPGGYFSYTGNSGEENPHGYPSFCTMEVLDLSSEKATLLTSVHCKSYDKLPSNFLDVHIFAPNETGYITLGTEILDVPISRLSDLAMEKGVKESLFKTYSSDANSVHPCRVAEDKVKNHLAERQKSTTSTMCFTPGDLTVISVAVKSGYKSALTPYTSKPSASAALVGSLAKISGRIAALNFVRDFAMCFLHEACTDELALDVQKIRARSNSDAGRQIAAMANLPPGEGIRLFEAIQADRSIGESEESGLAEEIRALNTQHRDLLIQIWDTAKKSPSNIVLDLNVRHFTNPEDNGKIGRIAFDTGLTLTDSLSTTAGAAGTAGKAPKEVEQGLYLSVDDKTKTIVIATTSDKFRLEEGDSGTAIRVGAHIFGAASTLNGNPIGGISDSTKLPIMTTDEIPQGTGSGQTTTVASTQPTPIAPTPVYSSQANTRDAPRLVLPEARYDDPLTGFQPAPSAAPVATPVGGSTTPAAAAPAPTQYTGTGVGKGSSISSGAQSGYSDGTSAPARAGACP